MEKGSNEEQTERKIGKISDAIAKLRRSGRNRESYDEIVELEAELRRAYIAKELQVQLLERETERYIENVRKQRAAKQMRLQQQAVLENDLQRRSRNLKESEDYRKALTAQIKHKEEDRRMMMEEARREREILTEIDRMREQCERSRTLEMKNELAERTRRERLIFQEMKQIRRQEAMEAEARERLDDEEYLKKIDRRVEKARKLREEQLLERERTVCEIASILINTESQKRDRETLLGELVAEDVKRELFIKEEEERIARMRTRVELAANLKEQIVFTEECKLRFVEQDRAFAEEIMSRITEDEKTARLTLEARRRMRAQYREDLTRLIETRRRIREEEMSGVERAVEEEKTRELIELERVKEHRKGLLEQHALNVAGFINKKELSEEELKIVEQFG